jgi:hypothetical protein
VQVIDGVRYRPEDIARLGLVADGNTLITSASQKGADDGGTVSGDAGGSVGSDKAPGDKPRASSRARSGK